MKILHINLGSYIKKITHGGCETTSTTFEVQVHSNDLAMDTWEIIGPRSRNSIPGWSTFCWSHKTQGLQWISIVDLEVTPKFEKPKNGIETFLPGIWSHMLTCKDQIGKTVTITKWRETDSTIHSAWGTTGPSTAPVRKLSYSRRRVGRVAGHEKDSLVISEMTKTLRKHLRML